MKKQTLVIIVLALLTATLAYTHLAGSDGHDSNALVNDGTSSGITNATTSNNDSTSPSVKNDTNPTNNSVTTQVIVYYFYSSLCPHCKATTPYIDGLGKEYPQITIIRYQVNGNSTNWAIYQDFMHKYHASPQLLPDAFIGNQALIGETAIKANLESLIVSALK